ncbi:MAG: arginase, partial [Caldilineaceae bacterium]
YVPDNGTPEPNGPDMDTVLAAVDEVMATGKVSVLAIVSVNAGGNGRERALATGTDLIRGALESWRTYGLPAKI